MCDTAAAIGLVRVVCACNLRQQWAVAVHGPNARRGGTNNRVRGSPAHCVSGIHCHSAAGEPPRPPPAIWLRPADCAAGFAARFTLTSSRTPAAGSGQIHAAARAATAVAACCCRRRPEPCLAAAAMRRLKAVFFGELLHVFTGFIACYAAHARLHVDGTAHTFLCLPLAAPCLPWALPTLPSSPSSPRPAPRPGRHAGDDGGLRPCRLCVRGAAGRGAAAGLQRAPPGQRVAAAVPRQPLVPRGQGGCCCHCPPQCDASTAAIATVHPCWPCCTGVIAHACLHMTERPPHAPTGGCAPASPLPSAA